MNKIDPKKIKEKANKAYEEQIKKINAKKKELKEY